MSERIANLFYRGFRYSDDLMHSYFDPSSTEEDGNGEDMMTTLKLVSMTKKNLKDVQMLNSSE